MKLLAVIFLVGLALTSAVPVPSSELSLDEVEELDFLLSDFPLESDDEPSTELGKKLQQQLDELLEKIKDSVEKGRELKEETLHKLKEIREQMKDLKVDMGKKAKELLEKIKDKAKDYWQRILDKLTGKDSKRSEEYDEHKDLMNRLKVVYEKVLDAIRKQLENGMGVTDNTIEQLKKLRLRLKGDFSDLDQMAIDIMHKLSSEKGKEIYRKILEKWGIEIREIEERGITDEIEKRLREGFEKALEQLKDYIEKGKTVSESFLNKLKDYIDKMKRLTGSGGEIDQKVRELMDKLSEEGKELFRKILEKLGIEKRALETEEITVSTNLPQRLKEKFEEIVRKIKDALENNKSFQDGLEKLKEIRQKLKDLRIELGQKGKDLVKELKEKLKDYYQKFLEKYTEKRSFDYKDMLRKLREIINKRLDADTIKAKIEELFGKGSYIAEQLIKKLNDEGGQWKENILKFIDKLIGDKEEKRSIKEVYEKIKNYFKDLQIELKEKFVKFGEWAKDKFEKGLEKGKDKVENLKKLAREFINDTKEISKDVAEQAKEFFREYKEDLGTIYDDVREKVREILNKN